MLCLKKKTVRSEWKWNVTYLKLWQTFLPPGSSEWADVKQQSRALRALRNFISTQSPVLQPGTKAFVWFLSFFQRFLPSVHPSLRPLVVLWLRCSQRGQSPRLSSPHFLGKSKQLPSIHSDTGLFKDDNTHTHTHWWGAYKEQHTRLLFAFFPELIVEALTGDDGEILCHSSRQSTVGSFLNNVQRVLLLHQRKKCTEIVPVFRTYSVFIETTFFIKHPLHFIDRETQFVLTWINGQQSFSGRQFIVPPQ